MVRSRPSLVGTIGLVVALAAAIVPTIGRADHTPDPTSVAIAGDLQSELGCPGDWQPDCSSTELVFDVEDDVWQATFDIPVGSYEYKAPLNDTWDQNYGANAQPNGANIALSAPGGDVRFYYDHDSHWVTDSVNSTIATVAGSFQSELGCPGDWQPDCLRSWMQDVDGDGVYEFSTDQIPAGSYEFKVALDEDWTTSFPGSNLAFSSATDDVVTFTYDTAGDIVEVTIDAAIPTVTIAGSLQDELGCPGDWQPDCANTHLTYDAEDGVYQGTFSLPAGSYEYKAALNDAWDENYGANAQPNGPNIALAAPGGDVKFYFDDASNWVTDSVNSTIATVAGSFQSELGCSGDWQPWCLRSWMQDADGNGVYTFATDQIPAGSYEFKVALDEDWAISHPAANVAFSVASPGLLVTITFDSVTNAVDVDVSAGGGGLEPGDAELVRAALRHPVAEEILYFAIPDRFDDGDASNNCGDFAGSCVTDDSQANVLTHGYLPGDRGYYHGGDIAGLHGRLDYLENLGVTAIWVGPIFENKPVQPDSGNLYGHSSGYHGYWITDFLSVDPHLGTNAEFQALVDDAHSRGIQVFMDVVTNHTADVIQLQGNSGYRNKTNFPYTDTDGNEFDDSDFAYSGQPGYTFPAVDLTSFPYVPEIPAGEEAAKNPAWLNDPLLYHNRGDSSFTGENSLYGDFFGLDDLWTERQEVVDGMIDIYRFWIEEFGVDGFRIDTTKHVNMEFWQKFGPDILSAAETAGIDHFFAFGEVFDQQHGPRFLSEFSTRGQLQSTIDFGFQLAARDFAGRSGATDDLRDFFLADDYYIDADSNAYAMPTFVGNHDMGRIGHFLQTDQSGADDAELLARSKLAHALMYLSRGQPVIYYGDEQGFTGDGGDKLARQDMFANTVPDYSDDDLIGTDATTDDDNFDESHPIYQALAGYGDAVQSHQALRTGAQIHRYSTSGPGIYAFSRIDRDERVEYVVAVNNAEADSSATIPTYADAGATFDLVLAEGAAAASLTADANGDVTVAVAPLGLAVYRAASALPAGATAPGITISNLVDGQEVPLQVDDLDGHDVLERIEVVADVDTETFVEVTFAASVDGGAYEPIGTDDNAPYRVFYDASGLAEGSTVSFKAIVDDLSGNLNADKVTDVLPFVEQPEPPPAGAFDYAVIHYNRPAGDYGDHTTGDFIDFWGLHLWGEAIDPSEVTDWPTPKPFLGEDEFGRFAWIRRGGDDSQINFIIHQGDDKDTQPDRFFDADASPQIWINEGDETIYTTQADAQGFVTIRYHRDDGDYGTPSADFNTFWGLHLWGDAIDPAEGTDWTSPKPPDGIDDFGAFWTIDIVDSSQPVNFIIHRGDEKDPGPDESFVPADVPTVWKLSGDTEIYPSRGAAEDTAIIHYHRPDGDYGDSTSPDFNDFWGLHVWEGALAPNPGWTDPVRWTDVDVFGPRFEVPVQDDAARLAYIIHRGDAKDPGPDQFLTFDPWGYEVWQLSGENPSDPAAPHYVLPIVGTGAAPGDLGEERAHWVDEDTIVWSAAGDPGVDYSLCSAPTGGLTLTDAGIDGGECVDLTPGSPYPSDVDGRLHLGGLPTLKLGADDLADVPSILTGQVAVVAAADGQRIGATGLQIPGVLDDLYATDVDLGVVWNGDEPTVRLWAPTAKNVTLHLFDDADPATTSTTFPMTMDAGVWSASGDADWAGSYYLYDVEVYVPATGAVETNLVTDPYSLSLSMNSTRSQIVDLGDPVLTPTGWSDVDKPDVGAPEDISIYELHVRDFSIGDETVPVGKRGTFAAFTETGSDGMRHLAALADAGLTHVHLLPAFDIATIEEDASLRQEPDPDVLATYPPDSTEQQAAVTAVKDLDGFNWGYDPFHYTTPEGSYSTDPDGPQRIVEFRDMVGSLNATGLRVVMDVVYNHTNSAGQGPTSVLDRIVPGYYHRLDASGTVETSTCCANTATEHAMMGKLMVDSVVTWAREYKVDGFRFDLMGHHSLANMLEVRAALDALTIADDGIDGSEIYLYGEGWNFGEVANDARFVQATQLNMGGTGIGTFSDRLRDAVRGGGPFDDGQSLLDNQGWLNGLWYDSNGGLSDAAALDELLLSADQIRVGLAGNLADYQFVDHDGNLVTGADVDYNGSPAGYTADPEENIVYIAAHDNQTLFDIGQYHHPTGTSMADRVRAQNVGNAVVALSQGVAFFHAGQDMLRSKSLDRDSFNSGDWFNRLDFTYQTNNWGVGLPVAEKNESNWPIQAPLLADPTLRPSPSDIERNVDVTREWLEVRDSTPLFHLETAADVQERLTFLNTGPGQMPGLIAMAVADPGDGDVDLDPALDAVVALFNPTDEPVEFSSPEHVGVSLDLHPVLAESTDPIVRSSTFDEATGVFTVPARTSAVFVDRAGPRATAGLHRFLADARHGWYRVDAACTSDDGDVSLTAELNGFDVDPGELVVLVRRPGPERYIERPSFDIVFALQFELTVTCTDADGNVAVATAVPLFGS